MTAIVTPDLSYNIQKTMVAGGFELKIAIGTKTAAGTDAVDLDNVGLIGKKVSHNVLDYQKGTVNAGSGMAIDGKFYVSHQPFVEGELLTHSLQNLMRFTGRPQSDIVETGVGPYDREFGIIPVTLGIIEGVQIVCDLPGLEGKPMQVQFWNADLMLPGNIDVDTASEDPIIIPFRIDGMRDPGALGAGKNPVGLVKFSDQTT